jgi:hypothetical protein
VRFSTDLVSTAGFMGSVIGAIMTEAVGSTAWNSQPIPVKVSKPLCPYFPLIDWSITINSSGPLKASQVQVSLFLA